MNTKDQILGSVTGNVYDALNRIVTLSNLYTVDNTLYSAIYDVVDRAVYLKVHCAIYWDAGSSTYSPQEIELAKSLV